MSIFGKKQTVEPTPETTAVPAVELAAEPTPEPPQPNYGYSPAGDRFPIETISGLKVITTSGNFSFRVGEKFHDSNGNEYIFIHLLPQTGAISYILCCPV